MVNILIFYKLDIMIMKLELIIEQKRIQYMVKEDKV